jgi:hypothetical protein
MSDDPAPADTADPGRRVRVGDKTFHLVKRRDGAGMVLVRTHPDDVLADDREVELRRIAASADHGNYRPSPRTEALADIDCPVARRIQRILYYRLDADTRATLVGGLIPLQNRGRHKGSAD